MKKWYIGPNIVLREEADEWGILFDPDTGSSVALNPVSVSMFKAMRKTQDSKKVEEAVRKEFDDVPDTIQSDIEEFVETLAKGGYVGFESE